MSQERWDVVLKALNGPLAGMGDQTFRGPVVRIGADPGPGGMRLTGYRGLDARQCVVTAYTGGSATAAPVGSNQVRMAPHANVNWKDIDPLRGPVYLNEGCALHLGPVGRGATVEFVECKRLGVWQQGDLASERTGSSAGIAGPGQQAGMGVPGRPRPQAIDARKVGKIRSSLVPFWFIGCLFLMASGTAVTMVGMGAALVLTRDVASLGPVEDGYEFYESIDIDNVEIDQKLFDGLQHPFYDFVMEANAEAATGYHRGLDKPKNWDQKLLKYVTASVQQHSRAWKFYMRLDAVKNEYSQVARQMASNDLPVVFAAIPYTESRYHKDPTSIVCAKGYWQFMPEVANRVDKRGGVEFKVHGCRFKGRPGYKWSPKLLAPPAGVLKNGDYMDQGKCMITQCDRDDRTNLERSTAAAIYTLGEAFRDPELKHSGAVTQITILSHNAGYYDKKYGVPHSSNVLPAYRKWIKRVGKAKGPLFYGENILCHSHGGKKWCGSTLPPEPQHYAYNIIAQHFLAVCYYGRNYKEDPMFSQWIEYTLGNGYCKQFKIPSKAEVQRRRSR